MCHINSLTEEQQATYNGLSSYLRGLIYKTLEHEVPAGRTGRTRDVFERILKSEGIAPTVSSPDAIDLAREVYTRGKITALSA